MQSNVASSVSAPMQVDTQRTMLNTAALGAAALPTLGTNVESASIVNYGAPLVNQLQEVADKYPAISYFQNATRIRQERLQRQAQTLSRHPVSHPWEDFQSALPLTGVGQSPQTPLQVSDMFDSQVTGMYNHITLAAQRASRRRFRRM